MNIDQLQEKALETAQRYIDYKSYSQNESKAISALKRKCPGWNNEEYKTWFKKAVEVHQEAIIYINQNSERAFHIFEKNMKDVKLDELATEFAKSHQEFNVRTLSHTLTFIFYLHHLR